MAAEDKQKKAERTIVGGKVEGFEVLQSKEFNKVDASEAKRKEKSTTSVPQPGANANLMNFKDYVKPEYKKERGGKKEGKPAALHIKEEDFPSL